MLVNPIVSIWLLGNVFSVVQKSLDKTPCGAVPLEDSSALAELKPSSRRGLPLFQQRFPKFQFTADVAVSLSSILSACCTNEPTNGTYLAATNSACSDLEAMQD